MTVGVGVGRGAAFDCADRRGTTTGVGEGVRRDAALRRVRVCCVCAAVWGSVCKSKPDRRAAVRNLLAASGKRDTLIVTSWNSLARALTKMTGGVTGTPSARRRHLSCLTWKPRPPYSLEPGFGF